MDLQRLSKRNKLFLGIFFDALGYVTFFIPGVGEFGDIVWAPASAYLMTKLYSGQKSKVAAGISFVEEAGSWRIWRYRLGTSIGIFNDKII